MQARVYIYTTFNHLHSIYRVTWQPAVSVRVLWPKGKQLLSIWLKIFMKQFIISSLREIEIATHSMPVINPRDKLSVVD